MKISFAIFTLLSTLFAAACSSSSEVLSQEGQNLCVNMDIMYNGKDDIAGWVDFEAHEGVTKEEINRALEELKLSEFETPYYPYSLETIQGVRGLFLEKGSENLPTEADFLEMLEENNYGDAKIHYMDKLAVGIYFPTLLTSEEQSDFSEQLIAMGINKDKLTWSERNPSRWGSVRVPEGEEAEYAKTLQELGLFECAGERHVTKLSLR